MIGRVTKQVNTCDHDVLSTVNQMWHLGNYEHFICNGQKLDRVETTLSVVSMQKSYPLPKVVAIFAAETASSYVRLDKTIIRKV